MSKVLGAVCLHYGKDYFAYALESIKDYVDEIVVYYTSTPSHGTGTHLKCPDTAKELRDIADQFNCTWFDVHSIGSETKHRQKYIDYGRKNGYDQILIIDSDEVHDPKEVRSLLEEAAKYDAMRIGVAGSQWITPWQSFNEYVQDGFYPIRVINLKGNPNRDHIVKEGKIYHMGYCINDELMRYKISCHGHAQDFINNDSWYTSKWKGYKKGMTKYLHPATDAYWVETKELDKEAMPDILKKHPYFNVENVVKKCSTCG